jgi:hypothetical protein
MVAPKAVSRPEISPQPTRGPFARFDAVFQREEATMSESEPILVPTEEGADAA